jgi:hypothetical protein
MKMKFIPAPPIVVFMALKVGSPSVPEIFDRFAI